MRTDRADTPAEESATPMPRRQGAWLIGLNLVLLGVLGWVGFTPQTGASSTQSDSDRPRGTYTMVSARIQGANADAIHILDASNRELAVLKWNSSAKRLDVIGWRSLDVDAGEGGAPR